VSGDLHLSHHDKYRTTGIDRTPLLQEILCGRKGIEDQKRPVENAEVVDVAFDRDKVSVEDTARRVNNGQPYSRSQSANARA